MLLYGAVATAFHRLADWAEGEAGAYPYPVEDWLRYQLPHVFDRFRDAEGPRILISGPSSIREDVVPEPIEAALQGARVLQGGLSVGTLDDVLVSLDLIETSHGEHALPDLIVLGLSPRFVASLPDERPFLPAIDRYHPRFRVEAGSDGPVLVPKSAVAGALGWLRLHTLKLPDRAHTALLAATAAYVGHVRAYCDEQVPAHGEEPAACPVGWPLAAFEAALRVPRFVSFFGFGRVAKYGLAEYLAIETSASKYREWPARDDTWLAGVLAAPDTFWHEVFAWDPSAGAEPVLRRFARLRNFTERHGIALLAVNLPENEIVADRYLPGRYAAYLALLERGLGPGAVVDLRRSLERSEFLDIEHATRAGAARFTERLIELLPSRLPADRIRGSGRSAP